MGEDVTAVMAKREIQRSLGLATKILATLIGLSASLGPVFAAWYSLKQARLEAATAKEASRRDADRGYETLANPLEQFRKSIEMLDWRVQKLENEHAARESMGPISPEPLLEPALKKPVPQTLNEVNAIAGVKE